MYVYLCKCINIYIYIFIFIIHLFLKMLQFEKICEICIPLVFSSKSVSFVLLCLFPPTIYTSLYSYVLSTVLRTSKLLLIYIYIYTHTHIYTYTLAYKCISNIKHVFKLKDTTRSPLSMGLVIISPLGINTLWFCSFM